ncbi:MAG: outer membrane homotrimeric porin [Desulfovibrionaceae bacterium]|nr:outer membrane homotrimeric porin [Desulfovibrionaceae bacterium]
MKRISTLLLVMAFMLSSVAVAKADGIDVKVKGLWQFAIGIQNNRVFKNSPNWSNARNARRNLTTVAERTNKRRDADNFEARHRVRTQINFIASEYLQGVLHFEIGTLDWGRSVAGNTGSAAGGALDADGINIKTKHAYLDWIIPNTQVSVRMGIQGMALPSTRLGNQIIAADVAGITVSSPITDWLSLTGFWARPFDRDRYRGTNVRDEADFFGVVAPMKFTGFAINPYFVWGRVGVNSGFAEYALPRNGFSPNFLSNHSVKGASSTVWYLGSNFNMTLLDPLVFGMDVAYGRMQQAEYGSGGQGKRVGSEGWYIAATLDYKFAWGTPGIFGWYGSGDDAKDFRDHGMLGRLPAVMLDGGGFKPTSFGSAGFFGVSNGIGDGGQSNAVIGTATGSWGIGIQAADVTFVKDLSHTLRFAYYRGTNDKDMPLNFGAPAWYNDALYLTTKDSVFEINFDHKYKIYENLTAVLELGYLHLRSDKNTWIGSAPNNLKKNDNAWKAELSFAYSF